MPFINRFRDCDDCECGLIYFIEGWYRPIPVPLKLVDLKVKVVDFVAQVEVTQEYVNREEKPIEATYMFPVEEEGAVVDFEAVVDGRVIRTEVKEKEKARKEYDEAIKQQKTAVLLEETKPDIFQIKVGQLKPGSSAKVVLRYISELAVEDKSVRLTIPTTIAPRYVPPTDKTPEAKKISSIPYSFNSSAPLTIEVTTLTQGKVNSINSPSHKIVTSMTKKEQGKNVSVTNLKTNVTEMNKDFVLLIDSEDMHKPVVFLETDEEKGSSAGMVSLVPSFNLKKQNVELVFLVDRSGSMSGSSIEQAKKALELFIHSMPSKCKFNIFSFGSHFDSLYPGSIDYTDNTLSQAKKHVRNMSANYGGTEIYQPLKAIYKAPPKEGFLRQVFVLTDGNVSNDAQVIGLVKKNVKYGRLFSLGLGNCCSRHLVKGIARAGEGTAAFANVNEDLRPKVMAQLKNALQPAVTKVKIEWIGAVEKDAGLEAVEPEVEEKKTLLGYLKPKVIPLTGQCPLILPPIYDGTRLLAYRLFDKKEKPTGVKISAVCPDGPLTVELALEEAGKIEGTFVHQLAARKRIQDIEEAAAAEEIDSEQAKKALVELGTGYRLASKHTSFVGVDSEQPDRLYLGMGKRDIANQIPEGYGGHGMASAGVSICMMSRLRKKF